MKLIYPACFYPEENGQYSVVFPDLNDSATYGNDLEDAIYMATDMLGLLLLDYIEDKAELPKVSNIKDIKLENENGFTSLVTIDLAEYEYQCGNRAVKKTLTIPAWMNKVAEKEGFNFSAILQDGIKKKLDID